MSEVFGTFRDIFLARIGTWVMENTAFLDQRLMGLYLGMILINHGNDPKRWAESADK